jgi:hypothetical protein
VSKFGFACILRRYVLVAMVLDISTVHEDEIAEVAALQNGKGDALAEAA